MVIYKFNKYQIKMFLMLQFNWTKQYNINKMQQDILKNISMENVE